MRPITEPASPQRATTSAETTVLPEPGSAGSPSGAAAVDPVLGSSREPVPIPFGARRWSRVLRNLCLASSDALGVALGGTLAYLLWANLVRDQPAYVYVKLITLLPLFVLGYALGGLYPGFGTGAVETLRTLTLRTSFLFISLAATTYVVRMPHKYARVAFLIAWASALVLVPLLRFLLLARAHTWRWWNEPVVLVGRGHLIGTTVESLGRGLTIGYRPIGVITLGQGLGTSTTDLDLPILGGLERAEEIAASGVRVALWLADQPEKHDQHLEELRRHFEHVILIRGVEETPVEGVRIRNLGTVLGVEFRNQLLLTHNRVLKRAIDIVGALFAQVVALPMVAAAALAIKIRDPGPVFYRQTREGLHGEPIEVLKLRTMQVDAENILELHLESSPEARAEWESRFKLTDDPRLIPGIGRFLRRWSIDELPQFWQVLRGDMSLVGPRPFPPYHLRLYESAGLELRRQVRPGLTGLWQVMSRSDAEVTEQQGYDSYYIRNWSIWMDLYIMARTITAVLGGRGAY